MALSSSLLRLVPKLLDLEVFLAFVRRTRGSGFEGCLSAFTGATAGATSAGTEAEAEDEDGILRGGILGIALLAKRPARPRDLTGAGVVEGWVS
jgi:hypothetical protein